MSTTAGRCPEAADAETTLLARARSGEVSALEDLYRLHHQAVLRFALRHAGPVVAEDLVAEAFTRTFAQLAAGGGPRTAVRAYLNTAVRNLYAGLARKEHRVRLTADDTLLEPEEPPLDPTSGLGDRDLVRAAFDSLPVRDRTVLWWTTVERRPVEDLAAAWNRTPQAISQHAFRAREALRLAYLNAHAREPEQDGCRTVVPLLSRRARGSLDSRTARARRVLVHLAECPACAAADAEITDVARQAFRVAR